MGKSILLMKMRKSRPVGLKLRQILQLSVGVCIILWLGLMLYSHFSDSCQGKLYTYYLCEEYEKGVIAGALCETLCKEKSIYLSSCDQIDRLQKYRTYYDKKVHYRVKTEYLDLLVKGQNLRTNVYLKPMNGTSMEQFQRMVYQYVMDKLGSGDHSQLTSKIMDIADVNKDSKVTLAEAKTIWSLLQHNEFFILLVFSNNEHTPNLAGFCGDMYAVDNTHKNYLYEKPSGGFLDAIFPHRYTWSFPSWEKRAKVVLGMLEFTSEAYQHESQGSFYMCDTNAFNIGYSKKYDTKFVDTSAILPKQELQAYLKDRSCESSVDCIYTPHCTTVCDNKVCSGELVHPNLHLICQIFEPFIRHGAPQKIQIDLVHLFDKCSHLSADRKNDQLEHSLLLNEFKSLMWKQISEA